MSSNIFHIIAVKSFFSRLPVPPALHGASYDVIVQSRKMKRICGLDVGDRNIGIAMGDLSGTIAGPWPAYRRRNDTADMAWFTELAASRDIGTFIVGLPLSLNGTSGPQAQKVLAFAQMLKKSTKIPVHMWDERLSSVQAGRIQDEAGMSRKKKRKTIDSMAAVIILQNYLDSAGRR